jgi:hypothetical protein
LYSRKNPTGYTVNTSHKHEDAQYDYIKICIFFVTNFKTAGRALTQAVSSRLPTAASRVRAQEMEGFVVGKAALGPVFFEYFGFPCQSFHRLLYIHHLSSGAGTIGQLVAYVPTGLISPHLKKHNHLQNLLSTSAFLIIHKCAQDYCIIKKGISNNNLLTF